MIYNFFLGRLVVHLKHKKYGFIKSMSGNIHEIFRLAIENNWISQRTEREGIFELIKARNGVRCYFSGVCKFRLGFNQMVDVEEEDL